MAVVISEIVTELVLGQPEQTGRETGATPMADDLDLVVRRASERVLEVLRREWDR